MRKKSFLIFLMVLLVLNVFSIPIFAYQLDYATDTLSTNSGNATIRGGIYTTNIAGTVNADTTTSLSIGTNKTTSISARVSGSAEVTETRTGYTNVDAYGPGNTLTMGSHKASSSIDSVSFSTNG